MNQSDPDADPVGSAAEEAAKLFGVFADWAKERGPEMGASLGAMASHAAHNVSDHIDTGAAECTWCPVCRAVHLVRQASPEVREQFASSLTSLVTASMSLITQAQRSSPPPQRSADVQNIDLSSDSDWTTP